MSDKFTGIGNIRPTYPIKPVEPSGKDRPSGERRRKRPERPPEQEGNDDEATVPARKKGTIDEYI